MALSSIYQGALLQHNSNPSCKHELEGATHSRHGVNCTCGDDITLYLRLGKDCTIEQAAFTGNGCAISQASADIMAQLVAGMPLDQAVALARDFDALIHGEDLEPARKEALGEAAELEAIREMPARIKCAQLGWRTLEEIAADLEGCAL